MIVFDSLDLALAYLERHFWARYIFPVKALAKFPPLVQDNLASNASNDPAQIVRWAKQFPKCNWAVAHRKSRLLVADVDCDPKKDKQGQATYDLLDMLFGWPATEITTTPSGGHHHVYVGDHIMALGLNGIGLDIDSPNYTLIPGCVFKDGSRYAGNDVDAVTCPQWIYDVIRNSKARSRITNAGEIVVDLDQPSNIEAAKDFLINDAEPAIEGSGGDFNTLKTGMYMKDLGVSEALAVEMLNEYYNPRCEPAWTSEDLTKKVANAYSYSTLSKVGGKTAEADFSDEPVEPLPPPPNKAAKKARDKAIKDAKARAVDATKPADQKDRVWTRQEVCEEIVYVSTLERFISRTDPSIAWKVGGFDNKFGYIGKGKLSKSLFEARKNTIRRPDRMIYKPTLGEFVDGCWNQWRPSTIIAAPGDTSLWDAHIDYLFPDPVERGILLNWLAGVLQQQQVKPMHALLLIGRMPGTGKSFIVRVLAALIGESNWQALTQDILANGFTGWATRTKLVSVEELRAVMKTEISKKLHPWITQRDMTVNEKNLPTFKIDQCIAFALMSNKPDAIELDNSDRRYLILETMAKVHNGGTSYYQKLYGKNDVGGLLQDRQALGAILYQLMNRPLGRYDIAGPAPWTAAKVAMKAASSNDIAQWISQNIGKAPFSHRVVTVEEIVAALPKFMQGRVTMKSVREALEFHGGFPWPDQIRPGGRDGDKLRVWLLGEPADQARDGMIPNVLAMYREDHGPGVAAIKAKTIGEYDAAALDDFGDAVDDFSEPLDPLRLVGQV